MIGRALENYDGNINYRDANYYQRGGQWERPVHVEIFSTSGESLLSQNAGMRIHGASIRHYPQKSLRLYADDWYGDTDRFTTDILSGQASSLKNKNTAQYKNLLLRNTGNNRNFPHFRDALMHNLLVDSTVDTAAYRPVNVFINGEYWGIHALREHLNEQYISTHYDLPLEDIAILERNAQLYFGVEGDQENYLDLLEFIRKNDISQPDIYRAVSEQD